MITSSCKSIPEGDLPAVWEYEQPQKPERRLSCAPALFCPPQSFELAMRKTRLLTAIYDCPFCGMKNEFVIADIIQATRNCSHCESVHLVVADTNPPFINTWFPLPKRGSA